MKCIRDLNQIVTLKSAYSKEGRFIQPEDLSIITDGAVVFDEDSIIWVGQSRNIPLQYQNIDTLSKPGFILTPEIVDAHTHLVFGGNRSEEYTMRLNGADYQQIAASGGGILKTMNETLKISSAQLFDLAVERIERINGYGVGSIEIKSGYALTYEKEGEITRLIHKIKDHFRGKVQIHNTFMAAHAIPSTFSSSEKYLENMVIPLLKELSPEGIIDSVDIFHETGYFCKKDAETLFSKALELSIPVRIHADEFNDNKGAILATKYDALSADHLLCTSQDGIDSLSKSNTVATLLPGTAYFLGKPLANARAFLDAGCRVALASDYNPGSCHCDNLILIASMAAKNLNMNIAELWTAITINAAKSLNFHNQGAIIEGMKPRLSLFHCENIDEITYSWGRNFNTSL